MKYYTNEGKTYCVVGTAEGTVTSASGVVIASFSANEQNYFTAPAGGFVTISDDTAIVTPVFDLAPSALVGKSSGGDTPTPSGDYGDYIGYIEYDDETGAIVDMSIPKYLMGNLSFNNEVLPEGFTDWKIDIPYLTNGYQMFFSCKNLTSFSGDLPALTNGYQMFTYCESLTSFSGDLSSLTNAYQMFWGCSNLTEWNTPLPNLTNGDGMFHDCTNLIIFSADLPALTNGQSMFVSCTNLTSFEGDLSSLTNGQSMFVSCTNLTSFEGDLSSLTNVNSMFNGCWNLTSFSSDLPNLTDGYCMFTQCSNLTSFSGDLPNLTDGQDMFYYCKLDAASVERILSSIPTYTDGSTHTLTLHFSSEAAAKFEEITGVTPTTSEQTVSYKGWSVRAMING